MTRFLASLAIAGALLVGTDTTQAQAMSTEFLCGAQASKQRMVPGSAARRAFIQNCIAAASKPAPELGPSAFRPKPATK